MPRSFDDAAALRRHLELDHLGDEDGEDLIARALAAASLPSAPSQSPSGTGAGKGFDRTSVLALLLAALAVLVPLLFLLLS